MTELHRRHFMRQGGIGVLAFQLGGATAWLTPRHAVARGVEPQVLTAAESELLAAFGDALLPGAAAAGIAQFVDQQLAAEPNDCMLMCKYFPGLDAPYADFYRGGLTALAGLSRAAHGAGFDKLSADQRTEVISSLWQRRASPWVGPPAELFYMLVRSDAVDVVYGTEEGFVQLNVPYMAHIAPPTKW